MVVALTACANVASQCGAWSNATHDRPEWQTAMKMLLLAGEQAGPLMFAWISIRRALDAGRPPPRSSLDARR
jgi:hypothetical protein